MNSPLEPIKSVPSCTARTASAISIEKHAKVHYSQISGGKREILSIDDDPTNQMVVEDLLIPLGYVVTCAMDGVEGLEILASRDYLPDLILLDVQMPLMTGYEVCAEIRRLYPESLPIIMISANHDESSILEGLNMGSNDYVQKPFSRAQLVARIDTHLRSRDGWMAENKKSNDLLGQVFPEHVTQKLKHGEAVISEAHDCVTVLFSDIVGYTSLSTALNTADVFDMLNRLYTAFDSLSDKHGVYKVDTIGDAYMVAAGHEESSRKDHHLRVYNMAKDMLEVSRGMLAPDGSNIKIRIGIHTGPAYFGIVGVKCPKYTLIGDTVNIASRMESNGFPMCIHVSSATQKLLEDVGEWQYFGCREIKGKGSMVTYVAKVGDWEGAVASMALRDCASTCSSPLIAPGYGARRPMPDDPMTPTDAEQARLFWERRMSLDPPQPGSPAQGASPPGPLSPCQSVGYYGPAPPLSAAAAAARLVDSSTQTDGGGSGARAAPLRFRERRSVLQRSMGMLEESGLLGRSETWTADGKPDGRARARAVLQGPHALSIFRSPSGGSGSPRASPRTPRDSPRVRDPLCALRRGGGGDEDADECVPFLRLGSASSSAAGPATTMLGHELGMLVEEASQAHRDAAAVGAWVGALSAEARAHAAVSRVVAAEAAAGLRELDAARARAEARAAELAREAEVLGGRLAEREREVAELRRRLVDAEAAAAGDALDLRRRLDEVARRADEGDARHGARAVELDAARRVAEAAREALAARVEALEADRRALESDKQAAANAVEGLERELAGLRTRVAERRDDGGEGWEQRLRAAERERVEAARRAEAAEARAVEMERKNGELEALLVLDATDAGGGGAVAEAVAEAESRVRDLELQNAHLARTAVRAQELERANGELARRVNQLEQQALERQLDSNYEQAMAAERAKELDQEARDARARVAELAGQAVAAEVELAARAARVAELERRCADLTARLDALERLHSGLSTLAGTPLPHDPAAGGGYPRAAAGSAAAGGGGGGGGGACGGVGEERLRDAQQRIRMLEVERTSGALLLEDLSRRYDQAAAALVAASADIGRLHHALDAERRDADFLRHHHAACFHSGPAPAAAGGGSPAWGHRRMSTDAGGGGGATRRPPCGDALRRTVEALCEGLCAACPAGDGDGGDEEGWGGATRRYAPGAGRSEVDELLGFLGLGHYAAALRGEDVGTLATLARLDDRQLEAAGVHAAASRRRLLDAARGLRVLVDRALEGPPR